MCQAFLTLPFHSRFCHFSVLFSILPLFSRLFPSYFWVWHIVNSGPEPIMQEIVVRLSETTASLSPFYLQLQCCRLPCYATVLQAKTMAHFGYRQKELMVVL